MWITEKTLLIFSIFILLTLVRLTTEEETPVVNHRFSFYVRVNFTKSIYLSVTSHEIWTFIGILSVSESSGLYSVPVIILEIIRDYTSSLNKLF